ncbi:cytochrome P450 [Streptomyces sp. NPDC101166]|uniref:cytochrome P450 family protein n=1 Tax=Streptomyces sp. NPDC101166 TaxID=3366120 RepID=UPI0037FBBC8D
MTTTEEAVAAAERCTPEYRSDPYPVYAHLREAAPVCPMRPPHGNETYLITRYEDAKAALADPRLSKDMYGAMDAYRRIFGDSSMALDDNMLNADPPKHTRLRRMVNSAFTPRRVQSLRPRIETVAAELLDACPTREPFDLLPAFAFPLPIIVICELLGVPPGDRSRMQHLSTTVAQTGFDPESKRAQQQAESDLHAFFTELITAKRARPGDDLLSALIAVRDTDGDGGLTETELVSTAFLLMFAGHKTTAYLIGNAVHHLLSQPAQLRLVRDDPELLGPAIDELLRYDGSVESATFRYATEDVEYCGTRIPKGALVQIALNSANRDPRKFDRPDEFDVTRKGGNAHLGFGHGGHYCLGAPLAKLEMELALTALFDRFPRAALARPESGPRWMQVPFPAFRGLAELPIVLDPAD